MEKMGQKRKVKQVMDKFRLNAKLSTFSLILSWITVKLK